MVRGLLIFFLIWETVGYFSDRGNSKLQMFFILFIIFALLMG